MRKRVYISSPMTQGDRLENLHQALTAYRALIELGYAPLAPQLTFFVDTLMDQEHNTWLAVDLPWVRVADAVLRLPGTSLGADLEEKCALNSGIPVFYYIDDLVEGFPA